MSSQFPNPHNPSFRGNARGRRHINSLYNRARVHFPKNTPTENNSSSTNDETNTRGQNSYSLTRRGRGTSNRNQAISLTAKKDDVSNLMPLNNLKALLLQSPEEILLTILNKENGFMSTLQLSVDWDETANVLLIIGKAISACIQMHVRTLIFNIHESENFLNRMQKYLISFRLNVPQQQHLDSLISLSNLLSKLQMQFPSSSSDLLTILLPQLKKTCNEFLVHSHEYAAINETLDAISEQNDLFLQNFTSTQAKTMSLNEKLQLAEPAENYRSIPVLPTSEDMHTIAFLRPNLVAGSYEDTEHYLDVQFRLLREDYIKPLRDGIAEYQDLKNSGKPLKNCKNVRVYEDVHIISQQYVYAGLVHVALFSDANFAEIKWEYSKRFLTGSLLCLTDDDFKTMLFATVAERNVKKLQEGKLILRFEELSDEVLNLSPQRSFTVIETTAYFEAYRHNLKALSELDEVKLPMQRYIVKVEKVVSKPAYLNDSITYDFRPLLIPLDKNYIKLAEKETLGYFLSESETDAIYTFPPEVEKVAHDICVLNDTSWPSYTELNIDPSQFSALKSAITKEFAVIQGPPGTGKTYIGLRIVQLLLHNFNKNTILKLEKSPILIVCYTNHALDQFLEGVSVFTQNIVRIGGRGQTEALERFQLSNLKRDFNYDADVTKSVRLSIRSKQSELFDLRKQIELKRTSLETSNHTVLKFTAIRDCIPNDHLLSLKSHQTLFSKNDVLYEWLGLSEGAVNKSQFEDIEFSDSGEETDLSLFPVFSMKLQDIPVSGIEHAQRKNLGNGAVCEEIVRECISAIIKYCCPLPEDEAHDVRDVSILNNIERWQLYKYWVTIFMTKLQREYNFLENERKIKQNKQGSKRYVNSRIEELHRLNKKMAFKRDSIKVCSRFVINEEMLRECIPTQQFASLKRFNKINFERNRAIFNWLQLKLKNENNIRDRQQIVQELQQVADYFKKQCEMTGPDNPFTYAEEELDAADIDDIEYIEAQRNIDTEEFADVSFDLPTQKRQRRELIVQETEWKTQGGKKSFKKYIKSNLYSNEKMSEKEANDVRDVWVLPIGKRWQLYKFWWQLYIENKQAETLGMQQKFRELYKELSELRSLEDAYVCQRADIVGMTTTGAAKYKHIIEILNPKIVIVEEAAEILESHIVTSLAPKTQHVILIGDHQQLRPSPTVHLLSVKYDLNVSLFERMIKNGMECQQLKIQHRMRPDVARLLVPHIYKNLENHDSVLTYEDIKGFAKNVFFLSHDHLELQEGDSKSKVNQHEARFLIKLCKYLILQNYDPSQITILTTYSGQLFEIKRLAKGIIDGVRITVVDNFQGEENDIILVSFVRSNQSGEIGFLKIPNRICVALSRARKGLYCIGNFQVLSENSSVWSKITALLKETDSIGGFLELKCQNHPEMSNFVASGNDFDVVQDGGCHLMCEYRLECGHVCPRKCHPDDMDHSKVACFKPCKISCPNGHLCQKNCYEKCGVCRVPVSVKMETCGHEIEVACFLKSVEIKCSAICIKTLPCGHEINFPCYRKDREMKCIETCVKTLICGHEVSAECFMKIEDIICRDKCKKSLSCGHDCTNLCSKICSKKCETVCTFKSNICDHDVEDKCYKREDAEYLSNKCSSSCGKLMPCQHICKGTCRSCHQGRLHIECNKKCDRMLICGHDCKSICSKICPPCMTLCSNWCDHYKCSKKCYEPCHECQKPCLWVCTHKRCTRLCGELCDRTPCEEKCPKALECGHDCLGFCGEPCPQVCKICDHDNELFQKSESPSDEKYIVLEDCNHVFESNFLSRCLNQNSHDPTHIQVKKCPKCETIIRKNFHFGNIVKNYIRDVEKVKISRDKYHEQVNDVLSVIKNDAKNLSNDFSALKYVILAKRSRTTQEILVMKNFLTLMSKFEILRKFLKSPELLDFTIVMYVPELLSYIKNTMLWIYTALCDDYLTSSNQRMNELHWEIFRLSLIRTFLRQLFVRPLFIRRKIKLNKSQNWLDLTKSILTYKPFREDDFLKHVSARAAFLDISIKEYNIKKLLPPRIINYSIEEWRKCKLGHLKFSEREEESVCYECKQGDMANESEKVLENVDEFEEIKKNLIDLLERTEESEEIFDWIDDNVSECTEPKFIRALVSAVHENAIKDTASGCELDVTKLKKRISILTRYIDHNENLELQALYAIQSLMNQLNQPKGILRLIFDILYDDDVITEKSFKNWEQSDDINEVEGKGVALRCVKSFFTWLKETDSGDSVTDE